MWYVVVDPNCSYPEPDEYVWTISRDPNETGWETDSGFNGYGLLKADAEELANAANEIERLITERDGLREILIRIKQESSEDHIREWAHQAVRGNSDGNVG